MFIRWTRAVSLWGIMISQCLVSSSPLQLGEDVNATALSVGGAERLERRLQQEEFASGDLLWTQLDSQVVPGAEEAPTLTTTADKVPKIKYISLISERHSGSTWMLRVLKMFFKNYDVVVKASLCNWKHWFQSRIRESIQSGERTCRPSQPCPACHDTEHTLVIAMWRNPYDWIAAMSENPHHAKYHQGLVDDLGTFLTKRWMVPRKLEANKRQAASTMDPEYDFCIDNFMPWEVIPCEQQRNAIYELDENGRAYDNVYELRKAKIVDFNEVREWAPHYEMIRYEDMLDVGSLSSWLLSLESKYGLTGHHGRIPGPEQAAWMAEKVGEMYYTNSAQCMPDCEMGEQPDALEMMNKMFDVELEASIGYHKIAPHEERVAVSCPSC